MTLTEIQTALTAAVKTGKIGEPVAARVHVLLPGDAAALESLPERVVEMLSPCFGDSPRAVQERKHSSGRMASLLFQTANGRTIFVTVGIAKQPALQLLVIGNHGIVRLEGADEFES